MASFLDVNNAILTIPVPYLLNEHDDGKANYFSSHYERLHAHSVSCFSWRLALLSAKLCSHHTSVGVNLVAFAMLFNSLGSK